MNAAAAHAAFVMTVSVARMYWLLRHAQHVRYINIQKLHPLADFLHSGTGYIEKAVFVPCRFQSRFQSTSRSGSDKKLTAPLYASDTEVLRHGCDITVQQLAARVITMTTRNGPVVVNATHFVPRACLCCDPLSRSIRLSSSVCPPGRIAT